MVTHFFQWLMLYSNVMTELTGQDQEDALAVLDDDAEFDKWLAQYHRKQRDEQGLKTRGKTRISQEAYLAKYARVVGDPEAK